MLKAVDFFTKTVVNMNNQIKFNQAGVRSYNELSNEFFDKINWSQKNWYGRTVGKKWNTSKSNNVSLSSDGLSFAVMISRNSKGYEASAWLAKTVIP